jgi:hypothetical protein
MVAAAEIQASETHPEVVPAKAGTHNPWPSMFETKLDTTAFSHHNPHGVWVPAFAGTTTENHSAAITCSVVTVFQFRVVAPTPRTFSIAPLDSLVSP